MGWLKKFGPAQNVLGPVKGQGISETHCMYIVRFYDYVLWLWLKTADLHNRKRLKNKRTCMCGNLKWKLSLFFLLFHHNFGRSLVDSLELSLPPHVVYILNWNSVVDFFVQRGWLILFCPKRSGVIFCPKRLGDFFLSWEVEWFFFFSREVGWFFFFLRGLVDIFLVPIGLVTFFVPRDWMIFFLSQEVGWFF